MENELGSEFGEYPEIRHLRELEGELARIEVALQRFTTPQRANSMSRQLFEWAVELDSIAERLQRDPHMQEAYTYDGIAFTHKNGLGMYMCQDGAHLLAALDNGILASWFRDRDPAEGEVMLLQHQKEHIVDVARARLSKFEESGDISRTIRQGDDGGFIIE